MRFWTGLLVLALQMTCWAGPSERYSLAVNRINPQEHMDWVLNTETLMSHLESCRGQNCKVHPGEIAVNELPQLFKYYTTQLLEIAESDFETIGDNDLVGSRRSFEHALGRAVHAAAAGTGLLGYLKYTGHGASNLHDYSIIVSMLGAITVVALTTVAAVRAASEPDRMAAADLIALIGEADYTMFQPFVLSPQSYKFTDRTARKVVRRYQQSKAGGPLLKRSKKRLSSLKERVLSKIGVPF